MLVVKTKDQLQYTSGSTPEGRAIGECLFVVSKEEWESFDGHLGETYDTVQFEEEDCVSVNLHELYRDAKVLEADPVTIAFIQKHGCTKALDYLREGTLTSKNKGKLKPLLEELALYYEYQHYREGNIKAEIFLRKGEHSLPAYHYADFMKFTKPLRSARFNRSDWNEQDLDYTRFFDSHFLKQILKSDPFMNVIIRDLTFKIKAVRPEFSIVMVELYYGAKQYIEYAILNSLRLKSFFESLLHNYMDRERHIRGFFKWNPKYAEPTGIAISFRNAIEKGCYYILNCNEEEEYYDDFMSKLNTQELKDFSEICLSHDVRVEDDNTDIYTLGIYVPELANVVACNVTLFGMRYLLNPGQEDVEDWGTCLNPNKLQEMKDAGIDDVNIITFQYERNR
jgi:hypothetical protein